MIRLGVRVLAGYLLTCGALSGQAVWHVGSEPIVRLGPSEGHEWGSIVGVVEVPSGGLVVADQLNRRMSAFDSQGQLLGTLGREGGGPGEFRTIRPPRRCGADSIFVWDSSHGRVSVLDSRANLIRDFLDEELRVTEPLRRGWRPLRMTCNSDGAFATVSRYMGAPPRGNGPSPVSIQIEVLAPNGGERIIGPFDGEETYFLDGNLTARPLGHRTLIAIRDEQILVGISNRPEILVYSLEGERLGRIALDLSSRPIDSSVIDEFVSTKDERHQAAWARFDYPNELPYFSDLHLDDLGRVWVEEYRIAADDTSRWHIYTVAGDSVASIEMPRRFRLHQAFSDHLVGVERDGYDVESVVIYPLAIGR